MKHMDRAGATGTTLGARYQRWARPEVLSLAQISIVVQLVS